MGFTQALADRGSDDEGLLGSFALALGLPPLPAGQDHEQKRPKQPDARPMSHALIGCGQSFGILDAALLFLTLSLETFKPLALPLLIPLSAPLEIISGVGAQIPGKVLTSRELLRLLEPRACVVQPIRRVGISRPFERGLLHALEGRERRKVIIEPALQQAPLTEQGLVRRLDCGLTCLLRDIGGQKALLDEQINQWSALGGNLREPCDAAARAACLGIDTGEPGDEGAAQKRKPRLAVARDFEIGVGCLQRTIDRGLDRTFDTAEFLIFREP